MILVIGGAYQGKRDFIMSRWKIREEEISDCSQLQGAYSPRQQTGSIPRTVSPDPEPGFGTTRAVVNYQDQIRVQAVRGVDPQEALRTLIEQKPDLILCANEIGMGIVPMDRSEREYREAAGRTLCMAAQMADEVWRVICGIGERIR